MDLRYAGRPAARRGGLQAGFCFKRNLWLMGGAWGPTALHTLKLDGPAATSFCFLLYSPYGSVTDPNGVTGTNDRGENLILRGHYLII